MMIIIIVIIICTCKENRAQLTCTGLYRENTTFFKWDSTQQLPYTSKSSLILLRFHLSWTGIFTLCMEKKKDIWQGYWHFCNFLETVLSHVEWAFFLPSLTVSFSPNMVSLALSSEAWMYPFFCLSVILRASRISVLGSSCCICRCIMVRNVEKSKLPDFSKT